ncbi:ethanolamine utilization protein EutJ [Gordonia sp. CPCC 205515]|uniref:ethanolamine utilization protein EutJ n=1 Tax=Gordonia sp. CPCC 205515 TaxID=3140791 RepID=UPI003AF3533A
MSCPPTISTILDTAGSQIGARAAATAGRVRTGIDLGTATCVITIVDEAGAPVWIDVLPTAAIRDGVVVDFAGAAEATRRLKAAAEEALDMDLLSAATAYPPCVGEAESRACRFVLEGADFDEVLLIDEVSAANRALGVTDGVVVDVGGGSTGVGVFRDGELVFLDDRPGGGHHLDLILSGALGVDIGEAERRKRDDAGGEYLPVLRPGFERIAQNIAELSRDASDLDVHLAGGALMYPGADTTISRYLDRTVHTYPHANLITPLGIARSAP